MSSATSPFVPSSQPITWERIDQGQDLRTSPGGAIVAPWAGTVSLAGPDPNGFGTHYALYTPTEGPHKGVTFYIGHAWALLTGKVTAGEAIARTGTGSESWMGNAKGIPGHVEIGIWGPHGPGSMTAGNDVAPIVKGAAATSSAAAPSSSSTSSSSSPSWTSFMADPVGSIVQGIAGPIEHNALRMLLYLVLIGGGVALVTAGGLHIAKPHEQGGAS